MTGYSERASEPKGGKARTERGVTEEEIKSKKGTSLSVTSLIHQSLDLKKPIGNKNR